MTSHLSKWLKVAVIKKARNVLLRRWRKGNAYAALVGRQLGAATVGNSTETRKNEEQNCHMIQLSRFWVFSQRR